MSSRRFVFVLALLTSLVMTLASCAGTSRPTPTTSADAASSRVTRTGTPSTPPSGTSYGFTLSLSPDADSTESLAEFKKDVDGLVSNGQEWVRVGIVSWVVAGVWGSDHELVWNQTNLQMYDDAIDYARSQGLLVYLITADGQSTGASDAQYKSTMKEYWKVVARRYAAQVTVWQIYNEVDSSTYDSMAGIKNLTSDYLTELRAMLTIGRQAIKAASPHTLVTTNTSGWPVNDDMEARWETYFDAIAPVLDLIALDVYPADNQDQIAGITSRITKMKKRYKKPVIIAEVGLQTCDGCWTEPEQGEYVTATVKALAAAKPMAILVYRWRDAAGDSAGADTFGVRHSDGTPKSGFQQILSVMGSST